MICTGWRCQKRYTEVEYSKLYHITLGEQLLPWKHNLFELQQRHNIEDKNECGFYIYIHTHTHIGQETVSVQTIGCSVILSKNTIHTWLLMLCA